MFIINIFIINISFNKTENATEKSFQKKLIILFNKN